MHVPSGVTQFLVSFVAGVHRAEAGHGENVCYEVHEQTAMYRER